jgi:hypothetical protein
MNTYSKKFKNIIAIFAAIISMVSCDNAFLDQAQPKGQITSDQTFTDAGKITLMVNGLYNLWGTEQGPAGRLSFRTINWLSDETYDGTLNGRTDQNYNRGYYIAADANSPNYVDLLWTGAYKAIYVANVLLEGLPAAKASITNDQRNGYLALAYFTRAQSYFYLSQLFGDVPLELSSDANTNISMGRTAKSKVLDQVVSDLTTSISLLPATKPTNTVYYTSKYQVEAYLSYVYLALGQWTNAEAAATDVITNGGFSLVTDLTKIFNTGSSEAILSIAEGGSTVKGYADYGTMLNYYGSSSNLTNTYTNVCPSDSLIRAYGSSDPRLNIWLPVVYGTTRNSKKYRYSSDVAVGTAAVPQTNIFMRLAEVYLIRAEARIQQATATSIANGIADINVIRARAGVTAIPTATYTQAQAMKFLETERVLELSFEARRWIDLARWGTTDQVYQNLKGSYKKHWTSNRALLPIPLVEIQTNPNLEPNNPGY